MDLHQGSNDYNPLRTKPITAAMKQDQKHIEGSVYDPSTGQTKVRIMFCSRAPVPFVKRRKCLLYIERFCGTLALNCITANVS